MLCWAVSESAEQCPLNWYCCNRKSVLYQQFPAILRPLLLGLRYLLLSTCHTNLNLKLQWSEFNFLQKFWSRQQRQSLHLPSKYWQFCIVLLLKLSFSLQRSWYTNPFWMLFRHPMKDPFLDCLKLEKIFTDQEKMSMTVGQFKRIDFRRVDFGEFYLFFWGNTN